MHLYNSFITKIIRNLHDRGISRSFIHLKRQLDRRKKYKDLDLWGIIDADEMDVIDDLKNHGRRYEATKPFIFKEIFKKLDWNFNESTFLDFGCGKGAVLAYATEYHFKKIIGIEYSKGLSEIADLNMKKLSLKSKSSIEYEILNMDASEYKIPPEVDCIYLFNPFDACILEKVVKNILNSLHEYNRKIIIIYTNAIHEEVLIKHSFETLTSVAADLFDVYLEGYKIVVFSNPRNF